VQCIYHEPLSAILQLFELHLITLRPVHTKDYNNNDNYYYKVIVFIPVLWGYGCPHLEIHTKYGRSPRRL